MLDSPNILVRLAAWRRAPAFVGLVALALLHVSAAAHQFEHSAEHDLNVCEACGAYSQLETTAVAERPGDELLVVPERAFAIPCAAPFEAPFAATYLSRAPPVS